MTINILSERIIFYKITASNDQKYIKMNVNLCFRSRCFFCLIIIKLFAYDRGLGWLLILLRLRRLNAVCVFLLGGGGGGEGVTSVNAVNP